MVLTRECWLGGTDSEVTVQCYLQGSVGVMVLTG
jgi:hypothetical protein